MGAAAPAASSSQPGRDSIRNFNTKLIVIHLPQVFSLNYGSRGNQQITSEGQDEGLLNKGQGIRANVRVSVMYSLLQKVK